MQPYVNPNYFAQYPQFNPYMQRMENLQQFQQTINAPQMPQNQFSLLGKIVESADIVKVTDIPMDGNVYYFPKADGTEIYSKQFLANGQTRILTFKPVTEDTPNNLPPKDKQDEFGAFNEVLKGIQSDIRTLSDKVDRMNKPTKAKRENLEDE